MPTEIIRSPQDTTVFINQQATFTCEINATFGGWKVNGTGFSNLSLEVRRDLMPLTESIGDNILVTLSIPGKAAYNKTTIQCVAVESGGGVEESENVYLLYQGT